MLFKSVLWLLIFRADFYYFSQYFKRRTLSLVSANRIWLVKAFKVNILYKYHYINGTQIKIDQKIIIPN